MNRPRQCPVCGKRLFLLKAGVYNCPKGHQTVLAGYSPSVRLSVGKRKRRRWFDWWGR